MARVPVNRACMHGSDSWLVLLNRALPRRSDSSLESLSIVHVGCA